MSLSNTAAVNDFRTRLSGLSDEEAIDWAKDNIDFDWLPNASSVAYRQGRNEVGSALCLCPEY